MTSLCGLVRECSPRSEFYGLHLLRSSKLFLSHCGQSWQQLVNGLFASQHVQGFCWGVMQQREFSSPSVSRAAIVRYLLLGALCTASIFLAHRTPGSPVA